MSLKEWCSNNKSTLLTSGLLLLIGLFAAIISFITPFEYFLLFDLFLGLPIFLGASLIDNMTFRTLFGSHTIPNSIVIAVICISVIVNVFFLYYLAKGILFIKRFNKKFFIAFVIVALFFLFGFDYHIVTALSSPDISCTRDSDCVTDFNQYSDRPCDYLSHNKEWTYYKPLVLRAVARAMCPPSPQSKCVNNTCQLQPFLVNRNV